MYSAARTCARPPQHLREPLNLPLSRLSGATPTIAAACRRSREPSSGRSASRLKTVTGPMPGTLRSSSSRSRHTGFSRKRCVSSLWRSRSSSSKAARLRSILCCTIGSVLGAVLQLGRPHLDDLPAASDQRFQFAGSSRDQRLSYDTAHLAEVGDHSGVDAVRLCELALGAGEVTNLTGVDDGNRDTGGGERGGQGHLNSPRWLP